MFSQEISQHLASVAQKQYFCKKSKSMSMENKREWRFYTCLVMGFALVVGGFFSPPLGVIHNSVIVVFGIFLSLGGLCVGVDLKGIIHEVRAFRLGITPKEEGEQEHGND